MSHSSLFNSSGLSDVTRPLFSSYSYSMICGATGSAEPETNNFLCDIKGEVYYLLFMVGYWSQLSTLWDISNKCDNQEKSIIKHLITVESYCLCTSHFWANLVCSAVFAAPLAVAPKNGIVGKASILSVYLSVWPTLEKVTSVGQILQQGIVTTAGPMWWNLVLIFIVSRGLFPLITVSPDLLYGTTVSQNFPLIHTLAHDG